MENNYTERQGTLKAPCMRSKLREDTGVEEGGDKGLPAACKGVEWAAMFSFL